MKKCGGHRKVKKKQLDTFFFSARKGSPGPGKKERNPLRVTV